MKKIFFTVTNDLNYDQRMIRICSSLVMAGYEVTLVGYTLKNSKPLNRQTYKQKRINCLFKKGKLFYIEYNIRLFLYLLFKQIDLICAIDLDTILPCLFISKIKNIKRVYDAHELFCEMKEIVTRPAIYKLWKSIEQYALPQFNNAYTVNNRIADEFFKMYGIKYTIIKNVPWLKDIKPFIKSDKYILYQGAVNKGRCFEMLIPAMKKIKYPLIVCGDGNFMRRALCLVKENQVENKVIFKGSLTPDELRVFTERAYIGINLVENTGLSNYLSLANKFFDYMHAAVPQLCVNYPAYAEINKNHPVALLVDDLSPENIAAKLNQLLENDVLYNDLRQNCLKQREIYNWQAEEKKLINFYNKIFFQH